MTGGSGVNVIYDSVGKDTFPKLARLPSSRSGSGSSFGNSSGPVPPFELGILAQKGSLFATRPTLCTYIATREGLLENANDVIDMVRLGRVKIRFANLSHGGCGAGASRSGEPGHYRLHCASRRLCRCPFAPILVRWRRD